MALMLFVAMCMPMAGALAAPVVNKVGSQTLTKVADTTDTKKEILSNDKAQVDVTNTADGYVQVAYTGGSKAKIKAIVTGPKGTQYNYDLNNEGKFETFLLGEGDGDYSVGVYVNTTGNKYTTAYTAKFKVKLKNQFAPFLVSNQYVNYTTKSKAVEQATTLVKGEKEDVKKLAKIYEYVVTTLVYDKEKAASVKSGYLPDIDKVLAAKKGICFDYASLMTAMLRSQGIPCKLVIGYTGTTYHAWINAYLDKEGWVDSIIYFDGKNWKLMDPTFASSSNSSSSVMKYIGDGTNYSAKYYY